MKKCKCDIAVIGSGPAGLFFALNAAEKGYKVIVLEQNNVPAKKLSVSGGGMCNFTNTRLSCSNYISDKQNIVKNVLKNFSSQDMLNLLGIWHWPYEEKEQGKIFGLKPAKEFTALLYKKCLDRHVEFLFDSRIKEITKAETLPDIKRHSNKSDNPVMAHSNKFTIFSQKGTEITSDYLCIACGSPAYPQLGGNDRILPLLRQWGHTLSPFRPALVPFMVEKKWALDGLSGISLPVELSVFPKESPQKKFFSYRDSLLFTHNGISGPAVLTSSNYYQHGDTIQINFLPEFNILSLFEEEKNRKKRGLNFLAQYLPQRLAERLLNGFADKKISEWNKTERKELEKRIHHYAVIPTGTESFSNAETARGGVSMENVTSKLESRLVPHLLFCGEILNTTGMLGGYNIHWAFASAKAASLNLTNGNPE